MTVINVDRIKQIYMGRDKICRCGCHGEYVSRGEPMFEQRVSRFLKMAETYDFTKNLSNGRPLDVDDTYMNISYGRDRALTIYFD
jgi:hypothetical protein